MATPSDNSYVSSFITRKYSQYEENLKFVYRVDIFAPLEFSVKNNAIKNETKKRKGAKRIMGLSTFRIILLKRGPLKGKKVTKNIHFYDLHEIKSTDTNSVCFIPLRVFVLKLRIL